MEHNTFNDFQIDILNKDNFNKIGNIYNNLEKYFSKLHISFNSSTNYYTQKNIDYKKIYNESCFLLEKKQSIIRKQFNLEYSTYISPELKYILSIDIGVKHLGLSFVSINKEWEIEDVIYIELIDITEYNCKSDTNINSCPLYHNNTYSDYVDHVLYYNWELFLLVDYILIERQPPGGYVVVEQLLYSKLKYKSILISPNSVHSFLNWTKYHLDYEQRKKSSLQIALKYIKRIDLIEYILSLTDNRDYIDDLRPHDISDSICFILYFINKKRNEELEIEMKKKRIQQQKERMEEMKKNGTMQCIINLEKYAYIG